MHRDARGTRTAPDPAAPSGAGSRVVVGGDSAMEEATFLTRFAKSVTVVVRKGELRASRIMAQRAKDNPKISFAWNSAITAIHRDAKVTGVSLKDTSTGEGREYATTGIFVAIGHVPRTKLVEGQVDLDAEGYLAALDDADSIATALVEEPTHA